MVSRGHPLPTYYRGVAHATWRAAIDQSLPSLTSVTIACPSIGGVALVITWALWTMAVFGDRPVSAMTRQEVQAYVTGLVQAGYAPKSIDNIHDTLSSVLRTSVEWG